MLFGKPFQRLAVRGKLSRRFAASDGPGVGAAHHHALKHSLAADQRFFAFAAFERRQELHGHQKPPQCLEELHKELDDCRVRIAPQLDYHTPKSNSLNTSTINTAT